MIRRLHASLMVAALCLVALAGSGCGQIAGNVAKAFPPAEVPASYKRLKGQSVAVLVWADPAIRTDWPRLQYDITSGMLDKLQQAKTAKTPDFEGTTFPIKAPAMIRYQEDHPEMEAEPITEVAMRLGVTRLIYVEVSAFQTRSDLSVDLYRGSASGLVKVVEVNGGKAKEGFEEDDIKTVFPRKSPEEGLPASSDDKIYTGTVDRFTGDLSVRFVPHPEEDQ